MAAGVYRVGYSVTGIDAAERRHHRSQPVCARPKTPGVPPQSNNVGVTVLSADVAIRMMSLDNPKPNTKPLKTLSSLINARRVVCLL